MSQREANSLPPSRPSSHSPLNAGPTPEGTQYGAPASVTAGSQRTDLGTLSGKKPECGLPQSRSRATIGEVLNPPEHRSYSVDGRGLPPVTTVGAQGLGHVLAPAVPRRDAMFHGNIQQTVQSPGAEQTPARGLPPLMPDGSRRILTPTGPRAASASFSYSKPSSSAQNIPQNRPPDNAVPLPRPQNLPPISSASSLPATPSISAPQPVRTNSQPLLGPAHPTTSAPYHAAPQQGPWPGSGHPPQPSTIQEGPLGFSRSASSSGLTSPATLQALLRERQGLTASDGTEIRTGRLPDGSEIPFTMDWTTGSARQSQKRSRNAEASGRHRSKRKAQASDMKKQIDTLEEEREVFQQKIEELTRERDLYRDERDQLREMLSRTTQSHIAAGSTTAGTVDAHGSSQIAPSAPGVAVADQISMLRSFSTAHPRRESYQEFPHHPNEPNIEGQVTSGGPSRSAVTHETIRIREASTAAPGQRPPNVARTASAPQLPPIGAMSGRVNQSTHGQSWEQDRSQEPWARSHNRPDPGWAAARPENHDDPPR